MHPMDQNPVEEMLFSFPKIYRVANIPNEAYLILLQYVDFSFTPLLLSEGYFKKTITL